MRRTALRMQALNLTWKPDESFPSALKLSKRFHLGEAKFKFICAELSSLLPPQRMN